MQRKFERVAIANRGEPAMGFIHAAREPGALHRIIPPANQRTYLVQAVERGIAREEELRSGKAETKNLKPEETCAITVFLAAHA